MLKETPYDENFSSIDPDYEDPRDFVLHALWNAFEKWEHTGDDGDIVDVIKIMKGLPREDQEFIVSNGVRWSRKFREKLKMVGVNVPEEKHGHGSK